MDQKQPEQAGQNSENPHQGHRARLYASFARAGLSGFSDVVVLELLLTYAIARKDTNTLAHRLLDTFGSLHGVFEAEQSQLAQVKGMTQRAALLIRMQPQLWSRCLESQSRTMEVYRTNEECAALLCSKFVGVREELVWMLCLDAKCKLLCCKRVGEGSVGYTAMPPRMVVAAALESKASSIMLAHNHSSGVALPSKEDVTLTKMVEDALRYVDICLLDHIIVAENDYVSLRQSGLI